MMGASGSKREKIGVFGGTFNPVHVGHVAAARFFVSAVGLDRLYVIPTNISPLKDPAAVSGEDRANMLRIAFAGDKEVEVSEMEIRREGTSYTRDTVAELRRLHPRARLYYLIGDDWLGSFDQWRDYRYILDNVRLTVANRSGRDLKEDTARLYRLTGKHALVLKNAVTEVSSSDFRSRPDPELLPEGVLGYIQAHRLYGL